MPVYRTTLIWRHGSAGVSETYLTPTVASGSLLNLMNNFITKRLSFMWGSDGVEGLRTSINGTLRSSSLIVPPGGLLADTSTFLNLPGTGAFPQGSGGADDSLVQIAAQVRFQFGAGRFTTRYFSGVPHAFIGDGKGSFNLQAGGQWLSNMQDFRAFLVTTGWQIYAQNIGIGSGQLSAAAVVQGTQTPPLLGITVKVTGAPGFGTGQVVALQGFRPPKGTRLPTVNGRWLVDSVAFTTGATVATIYLQNSAQITPAQVRITAQSIVRPVNYAPYPILATDLVRLRTHKRGRPSLAPRGRRLSRLTLDP